MLHFLYHDIREVIFVSSVVRKEMNHLVGHQVSTAILYFYVVLLVILGLHRFYV